MGHAVTDTKDNPLATAFDNARGWMEEQERLLTEQQRVAYEATKSRQALQRRQEQERLDAHRAQVEEQAKKKKLKTELALKPPVAVKDPNIEREIKNLLAAESRLEAMDRAHIEERVDALKKFEHERDRQDKRDNAKHSMDEAWARAVSNASRHEAARPHQKTHDNMRDHDRSD